MKLKVPSTRDRKGRASRSGFGLGVSHDPQGTTRFKVRLWHQSVGAIFIGRFDTAHTARLAYDYAVYSLQQQLGRRTKHATNYNPNETCEILRPDVQQQIAARLRVALRQRAALMPQQQQTRESLQAWCDEQQQDAQLSWHTASGLEPRLGCEQEQQQQQLPQQQQQVAMSFQGMATPPSEAFTSLSGMSTAEQEGLAKLEERDCQWAAELSELGRGALLCCSPLAAASSASAGSSHSAVDCSGPTHAVSGVATLMDAEAYTAMLDELLAEYAPDLYAP